jgi:predicted nucleic-acid-binding Zn-ribbon protein
MTKEEAQKVIDILLKKGVSEVCPRCNNAKFVLLQGFFMPLITKDLEESDINKQSVPLIVTTCDNCGYMSSHAAGALDLLPEETKN